MTQATFSRVLPAFALLALLGACGSETIYYRPGVEVTRAQGDEVACGRSALADAPVRMEREVIPGDYVPPHKHCDAAGNCLVEPGFWQPDRFVTRDVNKDLRRQIARQCMAEKGYQRITLPACSNGVKAAVPPAITTVMPRLTSQACVIQRPNDYYQIVPG
ncbi:hypothetical protein GLS40_05385 [Pseudooceanicola sp. 216_PA32_1]|uniref:Uncharacterized protein n=1 Tax=Pseudooceanicola pacificus TaxID=2676438 RepID=A0A844W3Q5_9RHOB|nr:hypothetical protein [Pseudooceanicola pacificus]MWB77451.1 hypothetical protein [Pseudooceanicola pacificus]